MFEINPVLSGALNSTGYNPTPNNLTARDISAVPNASALPPTTEGEFSFSDVLDTLNPLQHLPVISSIYRAITGDTISPAARIAGDVLYAGILGPASAVLSGIGAVSNAIVEAETGKDIGGTVIAALFGPDTPSTDPSPTAIAQDETPSTTDTPTPSPAQTAASVPLNTTHGFPLTNGKQPFGGVMDMSHTIEAQNRAIALSESSHSMRTSNTVFTNRLITGAHPTPPPAPVKAITPDAPSSPSEYKSITTSQITQPMSPNPDAAKLPQNLLNDINILRALNQYKSVAGTQSPTSPTYDQAN